MEDITDQDFENIKAAHALLRGDSSIASITLPFGPEAGIENALKSGKKGPHPGRIETSHRTTLFGTECSLGRIFIEEPDMEMEIVNPPAEVVTELGNIFVRFSSPRGPMKVRLAKPV
jgi:hypothetical protein